MCFYITLFQLWHRSGLTLQAVVFGIFTSLGKGLEITLKPGRRKIYWWICELGKCLKKRGVWTNKRQGDKKLREIMMSTEVSQCFPPTHCLCKCNDWPATLANRPLVACLACFWVACVVRHSFRYVVIDNMGTLENLVEPLAICRL